MSVAYQSTYRPTIGQPLSDNISIDILIECQLTCRSMLDWYVGRYIKRHISVDILTDTRPICRPTYRSTLGWYVDRYVGWLSVEMSTDMSVEECTKYTWSTNSNSKLCVSLELTSYKSYRQQMTQNVLHNTLHYLRLSHWLEYLFSLERYLRFCSMQMTKVMTS